MAGLTPSGPYARNSGSSTVGGESLTRTMATVVALTVVASIPGAGVLDGKYSLLGAS